MLGRRLTYDVFQSSYVYSLLGDFTEEGEVAQRATEELLRDSFRFFSVALHG